MLSLCYDARVLPSRSHPAPPKAHSPSAAPPDRTQGCHRITKNSLGWKGPYVTSTWKDLH